jgi:alpha-glucosidase
VAPEYGTLADLDRLVTEAHARGLRVLLDLVPCHTSVEHGWFRDSRSARSSPRRDWYIWADPAADGGPPNNWISFFGGSAWEWDRPTGQYYLHSFYPEQPNLNWRNPAVAEAMHDVLRFWFERGIDGFRVDAIQAAVVDDLLRDNPPFARRSHIPGLGRREEQDPLWNVDRPEVHDVVRGMRRVADEYPGRVLIGEAYTPVERLAGFLGHGRGDEFHLAFDFELLLAPWRHRDLALAIERAEALHPPGVWPTYALSNHDQSRHATRYGRERAPLAALMLLALRGVPVLYQGEEIGMEDATRLGPRRFDRAGRDAYRTPMQWDASPHGGFTSGAPWLPVADARRVNVAAQRHDPRSLLSLYRRLIALRRDCEPLGRGEHRSIFGTGREVLVWQRSARGERLLIVANLAAKRRRVALGRVADRAEITLSTLGREGSCDLRRLALGPLEGLVLRLPPEDAADTRAGAV